MYIAVSLTSLSELNIKAI